MTGNRPQTKTANATNKGIIDVRPLNKTKEEPEKGLWRLNIDANREALIYVPTDYRPEKFAPFALMFHGAGGNAEQGIALLQHLADESGIILLAPKSLNVTWDVIVNDYGADVEYINRLMQHVFELYNIDISRVAVGGFSDGASYALSIGINNGGLFTHIIAFSPGFMAPTRQTGNPRIYISHGTRDSVLPIENCSRKLVPRLKRNGYAVLYREFEGPHTIPIEIAEESVEWLTSIL